MLQQILAIFFVLVLLMGALAFLRKKGIARFPAGRGSVAGWGREIQILDRMVLTPQHSIFLLHVRQELILVGVSQAGCQHLTRLAAEEKLAFESEAQ